MNPHDGLWWWKRYTRVKQLVLEFGWLYQPFWKTLFGYLFLKHLHHSSYFEIFLGLGKSDKFICLRKLRNFNHSWYIIFLWVYKNLFFKVKFNFFFITMRIIYFKYTNNVLKFLYYYLIIYSHIPTIIK